MKIIVAMIIVFIFLLVLVNKSFKNRTKNCSFKITFNLLNGFSLEFNTNSTNKKDAPNE